jgi:hypothetical protein
MDFCRTVELVYDLVPLPALRAWLIRAHMETCPRCQSRLASRDEARGLLVAPGGVGGSEALWRRIAQDAGRLACRPGTATAHAGMKWRWAAAAASALVVALTGLWLLREVGPSGPATSAAGPAGRFEIAYVKVGGAPAQTFIYRTQGSDTVFVWAQRTP